MSVFFTRSLSGRFEHLADEFCIFDQRELVQQRIQIAGEQFDGDGQQDDAEKFAEYIYGALSDDFFNLSGRFQDQIDEAHVQSQGDDDVQYVVFRT